MLGLKEIKEILPHRYPFLLVDKILELKVDEKVVGLKNVSGNEGFFQGHYPDYPIMPGVLIAEAIAQVAGIMMLASRRDQKIIPYFAGIDKLKFRKPVYPGDQLILEAELIIMKGHLIKTKGRAKVNDQIVVEGEFMFALIKEEK